MKKLAFGFIAASAALFGFGIVAEAYTAPVVTVTVDDPTPEPGQNLNATMRGCQPGETVRFTLVSSTANGQCNSTSAGLSMLMSTSQTGTATAVVRAPSTSGTFTGTALGLTSGRTGTFTVTVSQATAPPGGLPATGAGGISTTTGIAVGLLVVGLGLFAVSQVRRRQAAA